MSDVLTRFGAATRKWFTDVFTEPTTAQVGAWTSISEGNHTLVIAPTGSGKTLAAFLWALDRLHHAELDAPALPGMDQDSDHPAGSSTKVLYISPLKALGVDVERNLRSPLAGIRATAHELGLSQPSVSVGVRSGDTPAAERRQLLRNPPDILITTPESLYLMLTSKARTTLSQVHTVIIDEIHAIASSKRGTHLALSLERLDALLAAPAQRIGLSATVEPPEEVARFLAGSAPVHTVRPESTKQWELEVRVPVQDMTDLPSAAAAHDLGPGSSPAAAASIWPHVENQLVDLVLANHSTIIFANSRRLAERLTGRLNEIYAEREGFAVQNPLSSSPAVMMAQAGSTAAADPEAPLLARAHHGSVSKDARAAIEEDLKLGRLRAVVATSSLELGIDMGLVDLVIQVESPNSVSSGLQRVGRAGHQVGSVSQGVFFPKHRADLLSTALVVTRMRDGKIEKMAIPANPLDVLAQQTLAAVAMEDLEVEAWFDTVRRAAPYQQLPRSVYLATLDMLTGKYPSDEFATLKPRIVWDRDAGVLSARPGAQRLAVISGGTIPDRGLFGVFLAGSEDDKAPKRVGELDEEMVYESRVGDIFALGATSWRIEDITHDRVLVTPAFGQPGKLPFWHGDGLGRPVELGAALGEFTTDLLARDRPEAAAVLGAGGLDPFAAQNLLNYLGEQREATGQVPNHQTFVVERFHDELGDWRVILHSPFGLAVHAPWALAVGARVRERWGLDASAMAADDGIVLRIPAMDDEPPGAELFAFEADEIVDVVTGQVANSALFAARFRECAARALLLPRINPTKRTPLWQQRQRASQLLDVARNYPDFPIILETVRECLNDVYDLPALTGILSRVSSRAIRLVEVTTQLPSPFAQSLLFGYVAQFLYESDAPLAERRAAALSLDPVLLGELLGRNDVREILDSQVIAQLTAQLQHLDPKRRLSGMEGAADLLRLLGPLTAAQLAQRLRDPADDQAPLAEAAARAHAESLVATRRAFALRLGGQLAYAGIEDAAKLRDALGTPLPTGIPAAFLEPAAGPIEDLVSRYARTHAPFTLTEISGALGLGVAVLRPVLDAMTAAGRLALGAFRPVELIPEGVGGDEYCDVQVLRTIRTRSLAALRAEVEPVDQPAFARFLPAWQQVGSRLEGSEGVYEAAMQLAGAEIPASALESFVLPARLPGYQSAWLDELTSSGDVLICGAGAAGGKDGWLSLHTAEHAPLSLPVPDPAPLDALARRVLESFDPTGAYFVQEIAARIHPGEGRPPGEQEITEACWQLFWAGFISPDTLAPVRGYLAGGSTAHKIAKPAPRARAARLNRLSGLTRMAREQGGVPARSTRGSARWARLPEPVQDPTIAAHATAEIMLERYGVLTRGSVAAEAVPGGFGALYRVLSKLEEAGHARRGYFIEKLGAAQFSTSNTIDRLRGFVLPDDPRRQPEAVVLAATDPANPYGAALPWPATQTGHRPGRKAGAIVGMLDGELVLYLERGGRTVLAFGEPGEQAWALLAARLVTALRRATVDKIAIATVNGDPVQEHPAAAALLGAGFYSTPQGIRFRR
ncbi:ATP-dependent helicase [Glutamicibacter protophormiae]|uniref:ATP-dependent Lhr-like helicase n=1 Tax=Glutamicibacter protophormiae TaxID=37930 RepID=A0ABS4XP77_GLUPR|nr:ATP-dependent helicase [Glutamicibacter protophormiae]MBP2398320.1 ATP-dependent Lhr-like helicase [Glutamicibacter protophormiae]GGL89667.1 DEAD/DEAH box helicase [Glutamicibacter protophormiae]